MPSGGLFLLVHPCRIDFLDGRHHTRAECYLQTLLVICLMHVAQMTSPVPQEDLVKDANTRQSSSSTGT